MTPMATPANEMRVMTETWVRSGFKYRRARRRLKFFLTMAFGNG
jgi:hypothetical protein|tara:strand:- start:11757 stop:11888 length:132 start_codon:yes stop_codon:yes gene_type:complete